MQRSGVGSGATVAALCVGAMVLVTGCTGPTSPQELTENPSGEIATAEPQTEREQERLNGRLITAAWENDVPRARELIAAGAEVNAEDDTEQSAFLIATSEGHARLLALTLRHGADVTATDSFNGTGLIRAAERGHWHVVGRLVQAGIPLDHVNNLGWTALHEAIILGDGGRRAMDTVRVLVAAGVDVELPSARDGVAPLEHAAGQGYGDIADLLAAAARVPVPAGSGRADQDLLSAAEVGDATAATLALRGGARLEARDSQRRTPLLLAAGADHRPVARLLVALGADPDALDERHDTPWLTTGVTGSVPMARLLLSASPDLTIRNRFGGVSLIPASERGHVRYVRWVTSHTAIDVDHVNDLGWTALLEAVILGDGSSRYQRIVRVLLAAGADPTIADHAGVTPLEHATARGQTAIARVLRAGPP